MQDNSRFIGFRSLEKLKLLLETIFSGNLADEIVNLRRLTAGRHRAFHRRLHRRRDDIQVLKLLLEIVHRRRDLD